ncbi:hypothetical protein AB0903_33600 [Streptomyces sp. NPDC048389]|uniref:hypothetical protein n=1 Tax=Streptomyces sp. NPDC048389 TaxID=3154622 RepID=UPI003455D686
MRRDVELGIITEALSKLGPHAPAVRVWGRAPGAGNDLGAPGNVWAADVHDLALHICTRLYGRPSATADTRSPVEQAADAKRARDLTGELGALTGAERALTSAPWYPVRPGDLVHVHYEGAGELPAFGETYAIEEIPGDELLRMRLLHHTADSTDTVGVFAAEAADHPLYEIWFEAGPHRLTIVRDGRVVHDGSVPQPRPGAGALLKAFGLTIGEAERYLERGDAGAALARLRSATSLPPCGAPGVMPEHADCARPKGHWGVCCDDADYVDPPHECPALPAELHAVLTVGAKATDVHFAGLYAEYEAAVDHASGFAAAYRDCLDERYVHPAPGLPGEMVLKLPQENELQATGVQLAVVVPLQVLPDPRAEDEWAAEGMATALGPEDYADDYRDLDDE